MKFVRYMRENVWVWAGTGMVLITLSGATRRLGLMITAVAVAVHIAVTLPSGDNE